MSKSKKTRSYKIDGVAYGFDFVRFNELFARPIRRKKSKKHPADGEVDTKRELVKDYEQKLAKHVSLSSSAVHAWRYKSNAPDSLEVVYLVADYFGVPVEELLVEQSVLPASGIVTTRAEENESANGTGEDNQNMDEVAKLDATQLVAVSRVYAAISDFLYMLDETDGCVWKGYKVPAGSFAAEWVVPEPVVNSDDHLTYDGIDLALTAYNWVCHVLEREWVVLGTHPIYGELSVIIDGPLLDIWNGKTDPDYRFHYAGSFENKEDEPYEGYGDVYASWMESGDVLDKAKATIANYL